MRDPFVRVGAGYARGESTARSPISAQRPDRDDALGLETADTMGRNRTRVLVFVRYFLPGNGSGGPVRSVANLIGSLGTEFDFIVFCLDRDVDDRVPYPFEARIAPDSVGAAELHYLSRADLRPWRLLPRLRAARGDVLYFNSLFDPLFTLLPLAATRLGLLRRMPCIVSPRGEFAPAALAIKAGKKRLFLLVARALGLYRGVLWRVSSAAERSDLQRGMPGTDTATVVTAGELPARIAPVSGPLPVKRPGELRIVATARLCRMKNIRAAIHIARCVKANVEFDIWGPLEDAHYWDECRAEIAKCPPYVRVRHRGSVANSEIPATLVGYHVFLLPTLGENFGHSIYEALACGLPAVISDRTPWRDLAGQGAGADLSLDDQTAFIATLEHYAAMDNAAYAHERQRALAFASKWTSNQQATDQARQMFRNTARGIRVGLPAVSRP
jgi:glycosyltransferase involved in cell wall biosynthesis